MSYFALPKGSNVLLLRIGLVPIQYLYHIDTSGEFDSSFEHH